MGRYSGKTCRLLSMLTLTSSFFLVELIVGYLTNSLALVGDSYHMLSDMVALLVGFASVRIAKWNTQKNTFGWARAEVLGALVNAVFLCALCFTIFVEALQRIAGDEHIHDPNLMLIVGSLGLLINVVGLFLFHGHSHGGHGHSHGGGGHGHGHSHKAKGDKAEKKCLKKQKEANSHPTGNDLATLSSVHVRDQDSDSEEEEEEENSDSEPRIVSSSQLNMKGVFLHILGDALGSVIVIISALVIKFVDHDWKYKIDPAMSMVMVIIILSTSIPLLRESALILLQTVPTHIHVKNIQDKLLEKVEGVLAIHEFHVWQLAGNRIIASAHIRCRNLTDYMKIAEDVKSFFHNEGIHSTTIQPEFVEDSAAAESTCCEECLIQCPEKCRPYMCCNNARQTDDASSPQTRKAKRRRRRRSDKSAASNSELNSIRVDECNGHIDAAPTTNHELTLSIRSDSKEHDYDVTGATSPSKPALLGQLRDSLIRSTHSLASHLGTARDEEAALKLVENEQNGVN